MTPNEQPEKLLAKLFMNGRSQAVRLPKSMRFEGQEVLAWKDGNRVILEPVPRREWPPGYWERMDQLGKDLEGIEIEEIEIRPAFLDVSLDL